MTDLSRYRIFTEPQQGATYDTLLDVALRAEQLGFGAFFRSDHYLAMGDALDNGGLPGPTDAWITLAGLARDTERIRLGTLVTAATFRLPGPLAVTVAGVDQMSGGRVELGIGAGWYEDEHTAYGVPFPALGERFDRLEEQLEVITGLWSTTVGERFEHKGATYPIHNSPALPKPRAERGSTDHRRRRWSAADAGAGSAFRSRVQHPVPLDRRLRLDARSGGQGMRADRAGARLAAVLGRGRRVLRDATRRSTRGGRNRSGATAPSYARTAWPGYPTRLPTPLVAGTRPGSNGSICRFSTSATSIIST